MSGLTVREEVAAVMDRYDFVDTEGFGLRYTRLCGGLVGVSAEGDDVAEEELGIIADVIPRALLDLFYGDAIGLTAYERIGDQDVETDGTILLGLRGSPGATATSPPTPGAESPIHEMSHAVEIDEARLGKRAWGLDASGWPREGTCPDVWRELRVGAIQTHLARYVGVSINIAASLNGTIPYLHGWPAFQTLHGGDWEATLAELCADEARFGIPFFLPEWKRRNALLDRRRDRSYRPRVPKSRPR